MSSSSPRCLRSVEQPGDRLVDGRRVLGVLGHVGVLIPGRVVRVVGVVHLNVAHARLRQPPRHQALAAVIVGRRLIDAVQIERRLALARQVEHVRRMVLHAKRQLVRIDHRFQVAVARVRFQLRAIQRLHQIELRLLRLRRPLAVEQIANLRILRRHARPADRRSLIHGRQKRIAIISRPAVGRRRRQHHERRQILILRAQPVAHPRAHRRPNEIRRAGVQKQRRRAVGDALRVHAVQEAEVIDALDISGNKSDVHLPLSPRCRNFHSDFITRDFGALAAPGQAAGVVELPHLAVFALQRGL